MPKNDQKKFSDLKNHIGPHGRVQVEDAGASSGDSGNLSEVDIVSQSKDTLVTEDGTYNSDSQTNHNTENSWKNLASLRNKGNVWRTVRPYVSASNNSGNTTQARVVEALDPEHGKLDRPSGDVVNGDGWRVVDAKLTGSSTAIQAGDDWSDSTYNVYSHYLTLQVKQGSGQETVDAFLLADSDK